MAAGARIDLTAWRREEHAARTARTIERARDMVLELYALPDGTLVSLSADADGARVGRGTTTYNSWLVGVGRVTRRTALALARAYVTESLRGVPAPATGGAA